MITWDLQQFAEKTEAATPRRRSKEREDGHVARSADLTSSFAFMGLLVGLVIFGGNLFSSLWNLADYVFSEGVTYAASHTGMPLSFGPLLESVGLWLGVIMLLSIAVALLIAYRQVGRLFSLKPLVPNLDKVNPFTGWTRLFSMNSVMTLLKATLQLGFIAAALYLAVSSQGVQVLGLMGEQPEQIFSYYIQMGFTILIYVAAMFVALSVGDYAYQKFSFEKGIKMSKDEIKDERRQSEGDPTVKKEIRKKGLTMAFRRMMKKIPVADVIVTNPTHYAVALKYDAQTMYAPQVIAKGVDELALRIRELGREHRIPVVENRILARALYSQVELDGFVPNGLFQAVAEVLAYVYKLRQQARS